MARLWIGQGYADPDVQKTVQVKIPQPYQEITQEKEKEAKKEVEQVPLPKTDHEARDIIAAFEKAARDIRSDDKVSDSVSQHILTDSTSLLDEQWLGTSPEEREA